MAARFSAYWRVQAMLAMTLLLQPAAMAATRSQRFPVSILHLPILPLEE